VKSKKTLLPLLISALTICLTVAFAFPDPSKDGQGLEQIRQNSGTHPALKHDFVSGSGEKILEVVEASYQITEKGLDSSFTRVRNLSGRNITALGLIWTVTFTDGGECRIEQLVDYKIHKDIVEAKRLRPFAPYEEKLIPRLTKESLDEGQSIENVKVEFAFVEFDDSSGVGVETSEIYKQLLSKREGAEIYRRWVEDGVGDDPGGVAAVVKKLSGDELPDDKKLEKEQVKQGALIYKQWMTGILRDKGTDALRDQLRAHQQLRRR
jgi:hypothetical protein